LVCVSLTTDKFEGELINSNEGHLEWIPNDQIRSLNLWEGDQIFLPGFREQVL